MTRADAAGFAAALTVLAEHFGVELSERRVESYFLAMSDHDLNAVIAGIASATKTCRFFPVPAELLDLIEGGLEDRGIEQFNALVLAARGKEHDAIDEAAGTAVEAIGGWKVIDWLTFRDCPSVDRATTRRDFLAAYRVAVKRSEPRWMLPAPAGPKELPGA